MAKNSPIKKDVAIVRRTFSYIKNDIPLNFNLRIDVKQELKDFLEILTEAKLDVEHELTKLN